MCAARKRITALNYLRKQQDETQERDIQAADASMLSPLPRLDVVAVATPRCCCCCHASMLSPFLRLDVVAVATLRYCCCCHASMLLLTHPTAGVAVFGPKRFWPSDRLGSESTELTVGTTLLRVEFASGQGHRRLVGFLGERTPSKPFSGDVDIDGWLVTLGAQKIRICCTTS